MYLYTRPKEPKFIKELALNEEIEDLNVDLRNSEELKAWKSTLDDYNQCKSYILDWQDYPMSLVEPKRQIRTHSCFSYCRNGDDSNFMGDDRPDCIALEPEERDQLICLYPDDRCETTSVSNPIVLGTIEFKNADGEIYEEQLLFAFEAAILAMILANPLQILWDMLTVHLRMIKVDRDNAKKSCILLSFQVFIAFLYLFIVFFSIYLSVKVLETGDSFLVFVTLALTWIIDQIK